MSFVRKHMQRVAERTKGNDPALNPSVTPRSTFTKMLDTQLETDLAALKVLKNIELRVAEKRTRLIPEYAPLIQRLKDEGLEHEVLSLYLVWLFDAEMIAEAMEHAEYCLNNNIKMPEKFKSDTMTVVSDSLGKWAEAEVKAKRSPEPYLSNMLAGIEAKDEVPNIPGQSLARLYKVRGLMAEKDERWQDAVDAFERAFALGENCKTVLGNCKKKLLKQEATKNDNELAASTEQPEA